MVSLDESFWRACRDQFPSLQRRVGDDPAVFFDGPAGTQVPQVVIDAVSQYFVQCNANRSGLFVTSRETDEWMGRVHQAAADLLGASDPAEVAFGANMTSLTFALSRALARTWQPGDEVLVSRLEHDANYTPWVLAARDAGATVRHVAIHADDCTLDLEDFQRKLSDRTKLVAVGCASNAVGTRNPVAQLCTWARQAGALTFLDGVHFAPHDLIDVQAWGCDFLACSAYKFFGPHVGLLWGRRELLESIEPYKLRPAPDQLPGRWMTGTQNHACLAGTLAAIDYLAELGKRATSTTPSTRRDALKCAFEAISQYERALVWRFIHGLQSISKVRVYGIADAIRAGERLPTVAWNHAAMSSREAAQTLGELGFFVWHGNYYALPLTETLGVEPDGMVRTGIVHYNTADEVDRLLAAIEQWS